MSQVVSACESMTNNNRGATDLVRVRPINQCQKLEDTAAPKHESCCWVALQAFDNLASIELLQNTMTNQQHASTNGRNPVSGSKLQANLTHMPASNRICRFRKYNGFFGTTVPCVISTYTRQRRLIRLVSATRA